MLAPLAAGIRCFGQFELAKRSPIGRVLICDPLVRSHALLLQELAHELTSSLRVALGLEEHIQHLAFGIDGPPEIHLLASNADRHLVEVPSSMWFRASSLQPSRDGWAEGEHGPASTLIGQLRRMGIEVGRMAGSS